MTEWRSYLQFAPGPVFGGLCIAFLLSLPIVWLTLRSPRRRANLRFGTTHIVRTLASSMALRLRWMLPWLRVLAIVALIYALARPQLGGKVLDKTEGIAIQMVLDISGSMSETDFALKGRWVRRLDAVKNVFRDFVLGKGDLPGRPNDLIGMTTFAMYADTRCPLTLDHANLRNLLDETEIPGWVEGRERYRHPEANNTSLGDAIVLATDELRRAGEKAAEGIPSAQAARSCVMILLTDGANNPPDPDEAPDPTEAANLAAALGIKIYTIGAVGTQRPSRSPFDVFAMRRAQVDEPTLRKIAGATGGKYFRATDTASLVTVYEEIDKLERRITGEREYHDNVGAARVAMLVGLALLMMEVLLVNTRYRKIP